MRGVLALALLAGCGDSPTYNHDIKPIVEGRCQSCHLEGGIGPLKFDSYADVAVAAPMMRAEIEAGTMPPWPAAAIDLRYLDDPTLTDEQIALFSAWVDAGMPEGSPDDVGEPLEPLGEGLSREDLRLEMPEPYTPTISPDEYRCFILDWTGTEPLYVTGFDVDAGNPAIDHHVAGFLFSPDGLGSEGIFDTLAGWDEADEGPGYSCYGGPARTGDGLDVPIQQIAQWVPGNDGYDFPEGTGILVQPGSKVVLQMHYNITGGSASDQTTIRFRTDPTVAHPAAYAPLLNAQWTFGDGMVIPAGQTATYEARSDPRALFGLVVGDAIDWERGFDVHSVMLHQHTLGASGTVKLIKASGEEIVLLDVPEYDFRWQITYRLEQPVRFEDGDEMSVVCNFDNTAGSEDVTWGENTTDEMCVANLYVSEPE